MKKTETPQRKIYSGAWIALVSTLASIAVFVVPTQSLALPLSFLFSLIALVVGYRSLKVIHQNPELFSGSGIIIPSLVVAVLVFLVNAGIFIVFLLLPAEHEQGMNTSITTDEEAIAYADWLRASLANNTYKPEFAQPFDGALVMTLNWNEMNALGLSKQEWFKGNETFYLVSWEQAAGNLVKLCSTAFTTEGTIALEPNCAVTERVVEETTEETEEDIITS